MNLTKDISLEQCVKSDYAIRHGIDNTPDKDQINNLQYLADKILQPLRNHYGNDIFFNSVYRCKQINDAAGSTDTSLHLIGCAADIDSNGISLMELLSTIYNYMPFTELIAEYIPTGWIHAGIILGRENDRKLKLKDKDNNYRQVSLDFILSLYGE